MKLKRKTILLLVVLSLLCVSLIVGVSYSIYQLDQKQTTPNVIQVGCFTIEFEDYGTDSSTYTNLSLTNSYPISTNTALNETPYKFKVTNTCDYIAKTNIAVNVLKTSSISQLATTQGKSIGDMVDISIKEDNNQPEQPLLLSSLPEGVIRTGDNQTDKSYIIKTIYLEPEEDKTYSLWMWVPESINGTEVGNEAQGLTLYSIIDVYSLAVDEAPPTPELYDGLIPVRYDNGNTIVASNNNWYDYDNHEWANAVLVSNYSEYFDSNGNIKTSKEGTTIPEETIKQYYVWIPRYKYRLFNAVAGESSDEQMIEIEFEDKYTPKSNGTRNGEWLTHPAFTFGNTELNGIWVGKFEPSHEDSTYINNSTANKLGCSNENCSSAAGIIILPNKISIVNNNVSNEFYVSRSIETQTNFGLNQNEIDTHMMKNMEWGAVAYLSSSKYGLYENENTCHNSDNNKLVAINGMSVNRCEIWVNNLYTGTGCGINNNYSIAACGGTITGCSAQTSLSQGAKPNQTSCTLIDGIEYSWNSLTNNGRSSTTGNIYGIYDMAGGVWEYVMGNQSSSTSLFIWNNSSAGYSDLNTPISKYYDIYLSSIYNSSNSTESRDQGRGMLGDATREIMKNYGNNPGGWFGNYSVFISNNNPWFKRGGHADDGYRAGIFASASLSGGSTSHYTFRIVLTVQ